MENEGTKDGLGWISLNPQNAQQYEELKRRMVLAESFADFGYWRYYIEQDKAYFSDIVYNNIFEMPVPEDNSIQGQAEFIKLVMPVDIHNMETLRPSQMVPEQKINFRISIKGKVKYVQSKVINVETSAEGCFVEGYIQDITDIVSDRKELESIKNALDNIEEEIYRLTMDGKVTYANQQVFKRYGMSPKNMGGFISNINPDLTPGRFPELVRKIEQNGGHYTFNTNHILPNGSLVPVQVDVYKITDEDGEEQIWGYCRDMSQSIEQKRKIKELDNIMRIVMDNTPVMMFVKDPVTYKYIYWNTAIANFTGVPASVAVGCRAADVFAMGTDSGRMEQIDESLVKKGGTIEYIDHLNLKNGKTFTIKNVKTVIRDQDSSPLIIGMMMDITDVKAAEQENIRARVAAEKSNKVRGAMLTNMSYHYRKALESIAEEAAKMNQPGTESIKAAIRGNTSSLLCQVNYIDEMLKMQAGGQKLDITAFNVTQLCEKLLGSLRGKMPAGVELIFDRPTEDIIVESDINRIYQVISNIIDAASQHIEKGFLRFGYAYDNGILKITTKDSGDGLAQQDLSLVLHPSINMEVEGMEQENPLRMLLCKMIVELMGGSFDVSSVKGTGSSFTITFACQQANEASEGNVVIETIQAVSKPCAPAFVKRREGPKSVLVAEDVDSNYQLLQALIGRVYKLSRAKTGLEALNMFRDGERDYDIILMDMKMPEMNGLEATREIRKISHSIPIVALTANAFNDDKVEALSAGCNDFLTKPVSADLLKKTIEKYTPEV